MLNSFYFVRDDQTDTVPGLTNEDLKKFKGASYDPFENEERLKELVAPTVYAGKEIDVYIDKNIAEARGRANKAEELAWVQRKVERAMMGKEDGVNQKFFAEFIAFLTGKIRRGSAEYRLIQQTHNAIEPVMDAVKDRNYDLQGGWEIDKQPPVGRTDKYGDEIRAYLKTFLDRHFQMIAKTIQLKIMGPQSLAEHWLYFKYIVKGNIKTFGTRPLPELFYDYYDWTSHHENYGMFTDPGFDGYGKWVNSETHTKSRNLQTQYEETTNRTVEETIALMRAADSLGDIYSLFHVAYNGESAAKWHKYNVSLRRGQFTKKDKSKLFQLIRGFGGGGGGGFFGGGGGGGGGGAQGGGVGDDDDSTETDEDPHDVLREAHEANRARQEELRLEREAEARERERQRIEREVQATNAFLQGLQNANAAAPPLNQGNVPPQNTVPTAATAAAPVGQTTPSNRNRRIFPAGSAPPNIGASQLPTGSPLPQATVPPAATSTPGPAQTTTYIPPFVYPPPVQPVATNPPPLFTFTPPTATATATATNTATSTPPPVIPTAPITTNISVNNIQPARVPPSAKSKPAGRPAFFTPPPVGKAKAINIPPPPAVPDVSMPLAPQTPTAAPISATGPISFPPPTAQPVNINASPENMVLSYPPPVNSPIWTYTAPEVNAPKASPLPVFNRAYAPVEPDQPSSRIEEIADDDEDYEAFFKQTPEQIYKQLAALTGGNATQPTAATTTTAPTEQPLVTVQSSGPPLGDVSQEVETPPPAEPNPDYFTKLGRVFEARVPEEQRTTELQERRRNVLANLKVALLRNISEIETMHTILQSRVSQFQGPTKHKIEHQFRHRWQVACGEFRRSLKEGTETIQQVYLMGVDVPVHEFMGDDFAVMLANVNVKYRKDMLALDAYIMSETKDSTETQHTFKIVDQLVAQVTNLDKPGDTPEVRAHNAGEAAEAASVLSELLVQAVEHRTEIQLTPELGVTDMNKTENLNFLLKKAATGLEVIAAKYPEAVPDPTEQIKKVEEIIQQTEAIKDLRDPEAIQQEVVAAAVQTIAESIALTEAAEKPVSANPVDVYFPPPPEPVINTEPEQFPLLASVQPGVIATTPPEIQPVVATPAPSVEPPAAVPVTTVSTLPKLGKRERAVFEAEKDADILIAVTQGMNYTDPLDAGQVTTLVVFGDGVNPPVALAIPVETPEPKRQAVLAPEADPDVLGPDPTNQTGLIRLTDTNLTAAVYVQDGAIVPLVNNLALDLHAHYRVANATTMSHGVNLHLTNWFNGHYRRLAVNCADMSWLFPGVWRDIRDAGLRERTHRMNQLDGLIGLHLIDAQQEAVPGQAELVRIIDAAKQILPFLATDIDFTDNETGAVESIEESGSSRMLREIYGADLVTRFEDIDFFSVQGIVRLSVFLREQFVDLDTNPTHWTRGLLKGGNLANFTAEQVGMLNTLIHRTKPSEISDALNQIVGSLQATPGHEQMVEYLRNPATANYMANNSPSPRLWIGLSRGYWSKANLETVIMLESVFNPLTETGVNELLLDSGLKSMRSSWMDLVTNMCLRSHQLYEMILYNPASHDHELFSLIARLWRIYHRVYIDKNINKVSTNQYDIRTTLTRRNMTDRPDMTIPAVLEHATNFMCSYTPVYTNTGMVERNMGGYRDRITPQPPSELLARMYYHNLEAVGIPTPYYLAQTSMWKSLLMEERNMIYATDLAWKSDGNWMFALMDVAENFLGAIKARLRANSTAPLNRATLYSQWKVYSREAKFYSMILWRMMQHGKYLLHVLPPGAEEKWKDIEQGYTWILNSLDLGNHRVYDYLQFWKVPNMPYTDVYKINTPVNVPERPADYNYTFHEPTSNRVQMIKIPSADAMVEREWAEFSTRQYHFNERHKADPQKIFLTLPDDIRHKFPLLTDRGSDALNEFRHYKAFGSLPNRPSRIK